MTKHAIVRGFAKQLGIQSELAVPGGRHAAGAMAALKQARDAGGGSLRAAHIARAQRHIAALDTQRHGTLVQHLQAHVLALQGRGADTKIAHVAPGEVVVPQHLQTPAVIEALNAAVRDQGLDPAVLRIGSCRNAINPRTGQPEFDYTQLQDDGDDAEEDDDYDTDDEADDLDKATELAADSSDAVDGTDGIAVTTPRDSMQDTVTCVGPARYSAVGPDQAKGVGAYYSNSGPYSIKGGTNGTVAAQAKFLGLTPGQFRKWGNQITISPQDSGEIEQLGGPSGNFTISDNGDTRVQNDPMVRFDIYRWKDQPAAMKFGKRIYQTEVTFPVASGAKCPPGWSIK